MDNGPLFRETFKLDDVSVNHYTLHWWTTIGNIGGVGVMIYYIFSIIIKKYSKLVSKIVIKPFL